MIDRTDHKMILELQANAREKNVDIAAKLGISEAGVRRRLARLTERGIIELTAIPNLTKIGYHSTAFIGLQVRQGYIEEAASKLSEHPDVHFGGIVAGQYDILIWAHAARQEICLNFSKRIYPGSKVLREQRHLSSWR